MILVGSYRKISYEEHLHVIPGAHVGFRVVSDPRELIEAGVEVLLDDRDERPGVMFADAELIGIPYRVTLGERGLKEGVVEYLLRRESQAANVPLCEVSRLLIDTLKSA